MKLLNFNPKNFKPYKGLNPQPNPDEGTPRRKDLPRSKAGGELFPELEMPGAGTEVYTENAAAVFAGEIKQFTDSPKNPEEYADFVRHIFKNAIETKKDDPVRELLEHLEKETDFYTAPASTHFHGSKPGGLIRHSLLVTANGIKLAPLMLSGEVDMYYLVVSCFFHDLCKVNMYEEKTRNVKNEETGVWEKAPYYSVRKDYIAFGHGIESMLRLNKYIVLPDSWNHAVRWHMGAYDIAPSDKPSLDKALSLYREVLFLQTADMQASLTEET